jgi:Uma2 family endonuclease
MTWNALAEDLGLGPEAPGPEEELRSSRSSPLSPRAPTEAEWAAMCEEERRRVVDALPAAVLPEEYDAMAEGDWHWDAKSEALDALRRYFDSLGKSIYVAAERRVYYPGKLSFVPDLLVVLDVDPKKRRKWVVSAEGRGVDLVMEILHFGDRKKDLDNNVTFYASLGIAEYFIYDCGHQKLWGYRLPTVRARRYEPIQPRLGHHHSAVLGLSLCIVGDQLRFFHGTAELTTANSLIPRLEGLVGEIQQKRERAEEELQAERQRAMVERERAVAALQQGVLLLLQARGFTVDDEARQRVLACQEAADLARLQARAATCASLEALWS